MVVLQTCSPLSWTPDRAVSVCSGGSSCGVCGLSSGGFTTAAIPERRLHVDGGVTWFLCARLSPHLGTWVRVHCRDPDDPVLL